MDESPEKWSLSMTKSDMETIDRIATKLGLSRSELVRRAVSKYARDNNLLDEYKPPPGTPVGAIDWIIRNSHGLLGDFSLPRCTSLIVTRQLAGSLSDKDINTIIRRYKQHVDFWSILPAAVATELEEFSSKAKVDSEEAWKIFYSIGSHVEAVAQTS